MEWELQRHDWAKLRAQGSAREIPRAMRDLATAANEERALRAYWQIDNTVIVQGALYEAAVATVACLLASLYRCTETARPYVLELLVQIGSGEPAVIEIQSGNSDIAARCRRELLYGFQLFLSILENSDIEREYAACVDLIGLCCLVDESLYRRARWYFELLESRDISDGVRQLIINSRAQFLDSA